jgi:hypothetical protein
MDYLKKIKKIILNTIIFFIKTYKKILSPVLPNCCRFYPTCSEYSISALKKHGIIKGSILSCYRILRCNPFNKGGIDKI